MELDARSRAFLQGVLGICVLVLLWCGYVAIHLGTLSSWPDQQSPPFELAKNSRGSWETRWEPTTRRERARALVLRHVGPGPAPEFGTLDLVVRVEPVEALDEHSRRRADPEGWVRHAIHAGAVLGIAEPAMVHRVEWRIGEVSSSDPAARFVFFVWGDPDSEHPGLWPFYAMVALFMVLVIGFLMWRLRRP